MRLFLSCAQVMIQATVPLLGTFMSVGTVLYVFVTFLIPSPRSHKMVRNY